jgi:hypothetical protein
MVMKAAEDGRRYDAAPVLDGAMDRLKGPMSPQLVIVGSILPQNPAQVGLAQDDDMVLCLSQTSSGWQMIANRAMLSPDVGPLQADLVGARRPFPTESKA